MKEFMPREHNRKEDIAKLAQEGRLIKNDLFGTDTYNDGLDEEGKLVKPGSTSTESGGTYMEDDGPQDLRRREKKESSTNPHGLHIVDSKKSADDIYIGEDPAAKWLRENDPNYKKAA